MRDLAHAIEGEHQRDADIENREDQRLDDAADQPELVSLCKQFAIDDELCHHQRHHKEPFQRGTDGRGLLAGPAKPVLILEITMPGLCLLQIAPQPMQIIDPHLQFGFQVGETSRGCRFYIGKARFKVEVDETLPEPRKLVLQMIVGLFLGGSDQFDDIVFNGIVR
ncbi:MULTISPECIES: hypothetical protein [unclassified Mesorhizobium]|uniref:hypothetical protein n=1 Tax=unclassified Mesorhizobium TaxID=325217 RepID=UPI0011294C1F|nr:MULTISPECIES: hypothetical protein [unclassified Mesorhizobium]TPN36887.1 hypothetical protein FJ979_17825 [Mesorhizobium sp. B1-1-6]